MTKSNVALRLQVSLLNEAKRVAEREGVALNQFIKLTWPWPRNYRRCEPKTIFANEPPGRTSKTPSCFSSERARGMLPWPVTRCCSLVSARYNTL